MPRDATRYLHLGLVALCPGLRRTVHRTAVLIGHIKLDHVYRVYPYALGQSRVYIAFIRFAASLCTSSLAAPRS